MKRRTKFLLATTAALAALGFAFYRVYLPHTSRSAVSKFGFTGASSLRSGGKIMCRRVFALHDHERYELEKKGLPVPSTTYSPWVQLEGMERDTLAAELADEAEQFINFATACRFHPDIEIDVHDASGTPVLSVLLCYSCHKWIASTGTHGRFPKSGALHDLTLKHPVELGWYRPRGQPPEQAVTLFGRDAAEGLLNPLNEIRIRRVHSPSYVEMSDANGLGLPYRPNVYSEWVQLNPRQAAGIRNGLLQDFLVWGDALPACKPRWDLEIEWLDESCRRAGLVTLCHTCGIWGGEVGSGPFAESVTKAVMLEVFPDAAEVFEP